MQSAPQTAKQDREYSRLEAHRTVSKLDLCALHTSPSNRPLYHTLTLHEAVHQGVYFRHFGRRVFCPILLPLFLLPAADRPAILTERPLSYSRLISTMVSQPKRNIFAPVEEDLRRNAGRLLAGLDVLVNIADPSEYKRLTAIWTQEVVSLLFSLSNASISHTPIAQNSPDCEDNSGRVQTCHLGDVRALPGEVPGTGS